MSQNDQEEVLGRGEENGWEDPEVLVDPTQAALTGTNDDFLAPPEEHLKETRRGRSGGPHTKVFDPAIGVPDPKFRAFKSDHANINQRVRPFIAWWNALPQWAKDRCLAYVYRDHPVLVYVEKDPEKKTGQEYNYIDKISGGEPLQDEMDMLNRYGCGNYKLVFNAIEPKKPNRTLCTVYFTNIGNNDFKSNPPTDQRISDTKNVDLDHPNNKAYVAYLRGVGLLPSQIDAIRGEQDMANVEILKESQGTTNKLVDALIDQSKEKANRKGEDSGVLAQAYSTALQTVQDGAKATIEMVREEARRSATPAAVAPTADPLELAMKLMELLRGGAAKDDSEVILLRQQLDRMRDDQLAHMREELKIMREAMNKPSATTSNNPFQNMKEGMDALKQMRETVDEISGPKESGLAEDVADAAGMPKWMKYAMPAVTQLLSVADTFLRTRSGQPVGLGPQGPPPGYQPNPQGYPQGPAPQWQQPTSQTPPQGGPQLVQARHPLATLDPSMFDAELTQVLTAIAVPLSMHLKEGINGTNFADWFMGGFGEDAHTTIAGFGPEMVVAALYSFPATATALIPYPTEKVQEFVAEFLNPQFDDGEPGPGPDDGMNDGEPVKEEPEPQPA